MNAAASPPRVSTSCAFRRCCRGRNASASTPSTATPKTSSIGESWLYSMCGGVIVLTARDPVTG